MSGVATAIVGTAVVGGALIGARAQEKGLHQAADLQQQGTAAAKGDINQYYGQAENLYKDSPWMTSGTAAATSMADLNGLNGPEAQAAAYAKFRTDPGYQFSVDQANQALSRSAMAKGNLFSGNFMNESNTLNQNMADQQYGNYYNRLMGISNTGFAGTQSLSNLYAGQGTALANADTNNATNMANLAVAGGQNQANMYGSIFGGLGTAAGMGMGMSGYGMLPTSTNTYGGGMGNSYSGMYQVPQLQPGLDNYGNNYQMPSYNFIQ